MKYLITESQYKLLTEKKLKIFELPSVQFFGDWETLQMFLKGKGNPLYSIDGYLDLGGTPITSLGNLSSVGGYLNLEGTPIASLGNLSSVGGDLYLEDTPIASLGNLSSVGGDLYLGGTPVSNKMTDKQIKLQVKIGGSLYL